MVIRYGVGVCLTMLLWMAAPLQACEVSVHDARLRLPPPVSDTAAVYLSLHNRCQQEKVLQRVSSPWAKMTMMHGADMHMLGALVIAPEGEAMFRPGQEHIMLMGLNKTLHAGMKVPLVLHWKDGSQQSVSAIVKDMRR